MRMQFAVVKLLSCYGWLVFFTKLCNLVTEQLAHCHSLSR